MTRNTLLDKSLLLAALRSAAATGTQIEKVDNLPRDYEREGNAGKGKMGAREKKAVAGLVDAIEVGHTGLLGMPRRINRLKAPLAMWCGLWKYQIFHTVRLKYTYLYKTYRGAWRATDIDLHGVCLHRLCNRGAWPKRLSCL